jgi:Uma2 family endonuclease
MPPAEADIDWSKPVRMTEAEYLAFEAKSEEKHEFDDGIVRPLSRAIMMAGGTFEHSRTISLTLTATNLALRGTKCMAFESNLAVKARNDARYSYPDISIICGEPERDPASPDRVVNNPVCVIEVLSPGTADYDRTEKFDKYARIASLREYVLMESARPVVQTLYREDDGRWTFAHFLGRDAIVTLRSVDIELRLSDIFPEDEADDAEE